MKTKNITITAIMISLSFVLAYVKVPSPTGSVALDALPAFALAGILGPIYGGIVGFFGHIATAANSSFYLGLHSHLMIAGLMFIAAMGYGYFYEKSKILAIVVAFFVNVVLSLAIFTVLNGRGFFELMWAPLSVGALINIIFATVVVEPVKKAIKA